MADEQLRRLLQNYLASNDPLDGERFFAVLLRSDPNAAVKILLRYAHEDPRYVGDNLNHLLYLYSLDTPIPRETSRFTDKKVAHFDASQESWNGFLTTEYENMSPGDFPELEFIGRHADFEHAAANHPDERCCYLLDIEQILDPDNELEVPPTIRSILEDARNQGYSYVNFGLLG